MRTRPDAVLAASLAALLLGRGVIGAQEPAAVPVSAGASSAVYGVVYDSLGRAPLARATVQIVRAPDLGGGRAVTADAAGTFRFDSLPPGSYLVAFAHALLDRLRVEVAPRVVDLGRGAGSVRVDLAVPALERVRAVVCGATQAPSDSSGLLVGRVRDAADDAPVANATVVLTWSELSLGVGGVHTDRRRVIATTRAGGSYVVCGVPIGEEIVATAAAAGRASGEVALEVPPRGFVLRDLSLGDTSAAAGPNAARLTGSVRDSAGRPVRGARVSVRGTTAATSAAEDGSFVLGGLRAGTRMLEVRAIGFAPRRIPVDFVPGRSRALDLVLDRVVDLDPVTVFGASPMRSKVLEEFFDRRRNDRFGRFLTTADLHYRSEVTDALRTMPGLQIVSDGRNGRMIVGRPKGPGACRALVILDGVPLLSGDSIDRWVSPQQVAGIEVYLEGMHAPPQYGGSRLNNCSVVLVWTRQ